MLCLTVAELNRKARGLLESEIGFVSVLGEISNLTRQPSRHCYFTLKDHSAQIRCAFFYQNQRIDLSQFKEGMQVKAFGKLSLYEPRGDYQLIVQSLEEAGLGEKYQQFIFLKKKLETEGLFSEKYKKSLPSFPQAIGVVTSQQAAALRDICITLKHRFPLARVIIYSSDVQGVNAPSQLCEAIQRACQENLVDVLILARGGGSIEDLWAFNDEALARTIFKATLPIITGIGHETDVTIADFVADFRAATPTAAAAAACPDQYQLLLHIQRLHTRLLRYSESIAAISRVGYLTQALFRCGQWLTHRKQAECQRMSYALRTMSLSSYLASQQYQQVMYVKKMCYAIQACLNEKTQTLDLNLRTLETLNFSSTLARGFSIVSQKNRVIVDASTIDLKLPIHIRLAKGEVLCQVLPRRCSTEE